MKTLYELFRIYTEGTRYGFIGNISTYGQEKPNMNRSSHNVQAANNIAQNQKV